MTSADLVFEFHNWLADEIPCTEKEARAELHSFPLPSLLIHYLNWRDRIVPVRPRTVMTWDRFLADKRTLDHWAAVNAHVERIVAGKDLTPYVRCRCKPIIRATKTTKEADKPPNLGADPGFVALIGFH